MLVVQRWSSVSLPAALQWQAVGFMRTAWPSIDGGALREPYPASLHPTYYAVADTDLLLSMAATFQTQVSVGTQPLTAICLGNVFTFPAARHRGYARQVVEAASADLRRSSADLGALLCDPDLESLYAAAGWQPAPDSATITATGETIDALRMMLPLSSTAAAAHHHLTNEPLRVPTAW